MTFEALDQAHRRKWAAVLAATMRLTRDFDAAEDAVQEAFESALVVWQRDGVPPNPGGWLTTTAKRKALDRMRRADLLARKLPLLVVPEEPGEVIPDQRLRLIFMCCHPALSLNARVALTLRLVCGLPTSEIAHVFLVPQATMAARLTTAKKKIRAAGIPFQVPDDLTSRLPAVLAVVYLVYTAGSVDRAVELASLLASLLPLPEVLGLLALVRLSEARAAARFVDGKPVPLAAQDRSLWDHEAIASALPLVEKALRGGGPYAVQAAIAALHATAATYEDTDWPQILALYDELVAVYPSATAALGRAVALAEIHGPAAGLAEADRLSVDLSQYYLLPAARAEFLRALGRVDEAASADLEAAALAPTAAEAAFFDSRARA
ncbi:sigma-70 family RNA polymerase sigma factor [Kibdelosporangium philippinense]|uniref:Sigma-70 family RNA polymerase sigma factor n=1 Tax=Kibdelosporangium philippinense TaxID=211113 RepID=A0ABS8ZDU3_9PSEU|nr:sigma-70 family RNA polymerase sigma factor [Kibdelosporangium philippinense]MCE7005617.1 sigma-70 family RNA polymerase sigma factor [Kibdelosporangium philippinense]